MAIFKREKIRDAQAGAAPRHTVLLVDDEPDNLSVLTSILGDQFTVLKASDGQEALDMVRGLEKPDAISLVISDQRMPRCTGVQLCEQLAELMPNTVRIIVTGYIDVDAIVDSINRAQIYKFIIKPFDRHDFEITVRRALEAFEMKQKLDEYVRGLETLVEQRTQALQNQNEELQKAYERVERLSFTDALTGLHNRHYLFANIDKDIALCQRMQAGHRNSAAPATDADLIFFLIDCDLFKTVNDHYGHDAGDRVLQQLADLLRQVFRDSDYLVRWGGEEFLVIARFTDRTQTALLAERLRALVADHQFHLNDGMILNRTVSIGCATYPFHTKIDTVEDWQTVLRYADTALYAAKRSGRNTWVWLQEGEIPAAADRADIAPEAIGPALHDGLLQVQSSLSVEALRWQD